jgi:hypothetical protein
MSELGKNPAPLGKSKKRRLNEWGLIFGTDKAFPAHTHYGRTYLDVYELYLGELQDSPITLLEMGVWAGKSLKTWRNFFPEATIIGLDINPAAKDHEGNGIRVEIMSQDDEEGLRKLSQEVGGFDIIIDDASHINSLTIKSFEIAWPLVIPGGYYIIEDVGNTHAPAHVDWPGMTYTAERGVDFENKREDFDKFMISVLRGLDHHQNNMAFFHYYCETIVMKKSESD